MGPNTRREFWRSLAVAALVFFVAIPAAVLIHGALPEPWRIVWFGVFFVITALGYAYYRPRLRARIEKAHAADEHLKAG